MANGPTAAICDERDGPAIAAILGIPWASSRDPGHATHNPVTTTPQTPASGPHSGRAGHIGED